MNEIKNPIKIKRVFISVSNKHGLSSVVKLLYKMGVEITSTGGTAKFIEELDIPVTKVEDITGFPSILGDRVKTLHPKVFGGILADVQNNKHLQELEQYGIETYDLVIVDLYPFAEAVAKGLPHKEIVEQIDIGGVALIRAAAKNYDNVVIICSTNQYSKLKEVLRRGEFTWMERHEYAWSAFRMTRKYDARIEDYFDSFKFPTEE